MAVLAVVALVAFAAPAFAANPFADVPAGHWAYDAVAQLAADGLISGYPDGAFKGAQQATRYEVAAMVARAVARGDELHASKKDVELLKKLCVEFKDELAALGAKTDKLDKRVTKLEKGIGSWKISGRLKFHVKEMNNENVGRHTANNSGSAHEWSKDTARLFFRRQIDENTYFDSQYRLGGWAGGDGTGEIKTHNWRKFYVSTKLPFWGINMKVGRWQFDFEGDYGLYTDEDALIGDWRADGFWFEKKWSKVKLDFAAGRADSTGPRFYTASSYAEADPTYGINEKGEIEQTGAGGYGLDGSKSTYDMLYALNLKWDINDKLFLGGIGYIRQGDGAESNYKGKSYDNSQTYGVTAGYKFTDGVALKGVYYWQHYSNAAEMPGADGIVRKLDDSQHAFKVILDIKQSVLKFTDLWVEYASFTNGFGANNGAGEHVNCYSIGGYMEPGIMWARPINNETAKVWFVSAKQQWSKKWGTFIRFNHGNWGTDGIDNSYEWGVGITYKMSPAISFRLAYDEINYGDKTALYQAGMAGGRDGLVGKDKMVFFETDVKF